MDLSKDSLGRGPSILDTTNSVFEADHELQMKIDERMRNIKKGPKKGVTVNLEDVKIAQGVVMVDQNGTVRKGQDAPK